MRLTRCSRPPRRTLRGSGQGSVGCTGMGPPRTRTAQADQPGGR
jgi:hypothetical protein